MSTLPSSMVLQWAMEIERNGEGFYRVAAAQAKDRDAKLLFEDLAYQEERHYNVFKRMLDRAPAAAGADSADAGKYRAYLETALGSALFAGPDKGLKLAKQATDEGEALKAALAFEKDTLLFFYDVREMVAEAERDAVTAIIEQERSHVRQIAQVIEEGPWMN
ncbi:MAG: ferritin family protein [Chloroflexi bacterium]|nr:ferritin family protein [Chloroflexota bacterium]